MAKRTSISKKIRFEIFKRDGFCCTYCGNHPPKVILEIDHIIPVCEGGDNLDDNLTTSCFDCNRGKGGRDLSIAPESLSEKSKRIKESEDQLCGYSELMQQKRERESDDAWEVADIFIERFADTGIRKDWFSSIKKFNQRLGKFRVIDSMELAVCRGLRSETNTFKYFCGICWNIIRNEENG